MSKGDFESVKRLIGSRALQSFRQNKEDFIIRNSLFDIRYSSFKKWDQFPWFI